MNNHWIQPIGINSPLVVFISPFVGKINKRYILPIWLRHKWRKWFYSSYFLNHFLWFRIIPTKLDNFPYNFLQHKQVITLIRKIFVSWIIIFLVTSWNTTHINGIQAHTRSLFHFLIFLSPNLLRYKYNLSIHKIWL